ncbi:MAG: hypothetical protein LBK73_16035 [Treponema sp.]|jgi:hypothetical protein|nr:hypothetical protein [Treponema sp.]
MQVSGGFSDLLNERFGFSFAFVQAVNLPPVRRGWKTDDLTVLTAGTGAFFMLFERL